MVGPNGEQIDIVIIDGKRKKRTRKRVKKKKALTKEQTDEIKSAFELFDRDESGNIDANELRDAMKALGIYLKKDAVKELMKTVDKDKSGTIEFVEFLELMQDKIRERNPVDELKKAFRIYDEDDTGKITFENLKKVS
jgi:Ca2+-binding EF-hand superfamily protein